MKAKVSHFVVITALLSGMVFALGGLVKAAAIPNAPGCGSALPAGAAVVAMAPTPSGGGYWQTDQFGDVAAFGDAPCEGSLTGITLNQPVVDMAATPSGNGYWLVASDGGIFSFGDAVFYGSTGNITLNQPVVDMAATPSGNGYWLVASDGGIFSFGDAVFYGSTGNITLNQPVVGMAATPSGDGYWLVSSDGGIFSFGDAAFYGRATVPASGQSCTSAELSVSLGQATAAAGSRGQRLTITDTASSTCTLYGYPGMLMLDSSGNPLPTHVIRVGTSPEKVITLAPGEKASFLAYWPDPTGYPNEQCPTSSRVEITPPNAYQSVTIVWHITPYGGTTQNLRCGQITVSPVEAGTTGAIQ